MTRALPDQEARDRIRGDPRTTLVVEAAAGTGKTTELISRIVGVVKAGLTGLDRIVAVTFTEAAAGELKLRLRDAIERSGRMDDCSPIERERLLGSLPRLEEARIGTIHSFCADLLRERPVEAAVDPRFEVTTEDQARQIFNVAFDRWFEAQLADPGESVRRILRRRTPENSPRESLRAAAWALQERRDFPAPWRLDPGFDRKSAIDSLIDEMRELGSWARSGDQKDYFVNNLQKIRRFVQDIDRQEQIRGRDYDGLEASLTRLVREKSWKWVGYQSPSPQFPKAELRARRDALHARLREFVDRAGADLAPGLREELWPVIEAFERLKARAGCLDFLDLLIRARNLVRDDRTVRAELQRRFTHIFVDEFQDTDPLQTEILLLISGDDPDVSDWTRVSPSPGKLFIVGDPKQSIYRFRRADVGLYQKVREQVVKGGGALVELTVSFRSRPEIQEAVNAAFSKRMGDEPATQARYVPLSPFREPDPGQPAIIALPVPEPYSPYGKIAKWAIDESLPDAVAAFVDWLLTSSGWRITERDHPEGSIPVEPRHVCILFRKLRSYFRNSYTDTTRSYVEALEARGVPHLLVGGTSFHNREEIESIRNAISAIERPEDEMAVFATLKGPLFAVGDEALLAFRSRVGTIHPFKALSEEPPADLKEVGEALQILADLHRGRNHRPIADTIGILLTATRAHAGLAISPRGEQALANISRLLDMARRVEGGGLTSFRSFVEWLHDQASTGEAGDAPIIEQGTEGVRIMSVHRAKGLEFPVVILADITTNSTPREAQSWVDANRGLCVSRLAGCLPPELQEHAEEELALESEEATRVLYVASTRARDLLVIPAVADAKQEGWVGVLNPIIYPPASRASSPESSDPPGCPVFTSSNAILRPSGIKRPAGTVSPGLHRPELGSHTVVWWDPASLKLGVRETVGLTQHQLLTADEERVKSQVGIAAHAEWQTQRTTVRTLASVPEVNAKAATEYVIVRPEISERLPQVTVETVGQVEKRPHGERFGMLVHAILAAVDLDGESESVQAVAEIEARILGATARERDSAVESVRAALSHPIVRRAAAAARKGDCRRESPVAILLEDGTLVEGVVDLAFREENGSEWVVIDFKTDVRISGHIDQYRMQVGLYALAISRATGTPCRGLLLQIR